MADRGRVSGQFPGKAGSPRPDKRLPEALREAVDLAWAARARHAPVEPAPTPPFSPEVEEQAKAHAKACPVCQRAPGCPDLARIFAVARPDDAHWDALAEIEAQREEQDRASQLPFGEPAMEVLRGLRASARTYAETFPSAAGWRKFIQEVVAPAYNAISPYDRLCLDCGERFALRDGREALADYCSPKCSARKRNRGRDKRNGGRSEAEARGTRAGERLKRHMAKCPSCKAGLDCGTREALLTADEVALRSVSSDVHGSRRKP